MIYLLAIGSPTHPVGPETWDAWTRPTIHYQGIEYISGNDPLFTHQYSQAWYDFRHKRDKYADYFENSVKATHAHKLFCLSLRDKFPDYNENFWGISASDFAGGRRGAERLRILPPERGAGERLVEHGEAVEQARGKAGCALGRGDLAHLADVAPGHGWRRGRASRRALDEVRERVADVVQDVVHDAVRVRRPQRLGEHGERALVDRRGAHLHG